MFIKHLGATTKYLSATPMDTQGRHQDLQRRLHRHNRSVGVEVHRVDAGFAVVTT